MKSGALERRRMETTSRRTCSVAVAVSASIGVPGNFCAWWNATFGSQRAAMQRAHSSTPHAHRAADSHADIRHNYEFMRAFTRPSSL